MKPRKRQAAGKITADGVEIEWELRREAHYSSFEGLKGMQFSARAVSDTARTFRELILEFPFPQKKPGKLLEKERILPEKIEAAIRQDYSHALLFELIDFAVSLLQGQDLLNPHLRDTPCAELRSRSTIGFAVYR